MNTQQALEDALTFLESRGVKGGDVHDYFAQAIERLKAAAPAAMASELEVIL